MLILGLGVWNVLRGEMESVGVGRSLQWPFVSTDNGRKDDDAMWCGVGKVVQGLPMKTRLLIACKLQYFGMKELGQCLPSIDELRKSNN